MYRQLSLSYAQWKALKIDQSLPAYYIQEENRYIPFMVDLTKQFVYRTEVMRDPWAPASADLIDFQTNIKPSATVEISIDNGIAAQIIL